MDLAPRRGSSAQYYLTALAASLDGRSTGVERGRRVPVRQSGGAAAVHALLGINAHINYDLALGSTGTSSSTARRRTPGFSAATVTTTTCE